MPQKYTQRPGSRWQTKQSSKLLEKCLYALKAQKISQQKAKILFPGELQRNWNVINWWNQVSSLHSPKNKKFENFIIQNSLAFPSVLLKYDTLQRITQSQKAASQDIQKPPPWSLMQILSWSITQSTTSMMGNNHNVINNFCA